MKKILFNLVFVLALLAAAIPALATSLTVSATTFNNWTFGGTSLTIRIYPTHAFVTSTNATVLSGTTGGFYKTVTCTVASSTVTCPSFTIDSTTDGTPNSSKYTADIYDWNGRLRGTFMSQFRVPTTLGGTVTWEQLRIYNGSTSVTLPATYYTTDQVNTLMAGKQATLVSGTNIKTVNGQSLIGSGNVSVSGSTADGDKGDVTVTDGGATWTVNAPLLLGDADLAPIGVANPFSSGFLQTGFSTRRTISSSQGFTGVENQYPINLNGSSGKSYYGHYTRFDTQGTSTNPTVYGSYVDMFGNSTFLTGGEIAGMATSVDVGGGPWTNAYGGRFSAFMGGSGAGGTGAITGVFGQAGAIHNGNVTNAFGGDFEVFTSSGSPGTLTMGAAVRARMRLNSGATFTDFRGVSISDWTSPSGGSVTNAYGLYIDNSIDSFGTSSRYAIRSLSTSPSTFAGTVSGVSNAYDATTWNGSVKFATEDSIRDKFESLGTSSVTGSGVADRFAMWSSGSVLTNVPMTYNSGTDKFTLFKTATSDAFRFEFTPSTTGTGVMNIGGLTASTNKIEIDQGVNRITIDTRKARLGDFSNVTNGTYLEVNDAAKSFFFQSGSQDATVDYTFVQNFVYQTSLSGTTGNKTINVPIGTVKFAAAATSLVVTSSIASTSSVIFLTPQTTDATCKYFTLTKASGSFTINANAACTANTDVGFQVTN